MAPSILHFALLFLAASLPYTFARDPTATGQTSYLVNCHADRSALADCRARLGTSTDACSQFFVTARGAVGVMQFSVNPEGWSMGLSGPRVPTGQWSPTNADALKLMVPRDTAAFRWYRVWEGGSWTFKGMDGWNGQTVVARVNSGNHQAGKEMGSIEVTCSEGDYMCANKGPVKATLRGSELYYVFRSQTGYFKGDGMSKKVWYYCWKVYEATL
ncbi:hypothetical protein HDU96_007045 [Phlyctochytrium bullatum]|nr:hypothetical protein HDU96_007045 [Phlyctochytrium bullatum]